MHPLLESLAQIRDIRPEFCQQFRRRAGLFLKQSKQQVFRADRFRVQAIRFILRVK